MMNETEFIRAVRKYQEMKEKEMQGEFVNSCFLYKYGYEPVWNEDGRLVELVSPRDEIITVRYQDLKDIEN